MKKPTRRLGFQLIASHILVALVSLATTGILVVVLAPRFIAILTNQHGTGQAGQTRGQGQGIGHQTITAVEQSLFWGLLAGLVAAVVLGIIASRSVVKSVDAVRQATKRLADGDYTAELPQPSTVELGELASDVQTMADRLAEAEQRRTRLIGEVSHEMRTPLTVIDGQVEAMIDGVLPINDENLAVITGESRRLRRLATDLSALSRAEEGRIALDLQPIDLVDVVGGVANRLRPQTLDAGIDLICEPTTGVRVLADADRIGQVITNLVGNAIRATPPGGTITVTCGSEGAEAVVRVTDTGEGLAAADVERVFERFYRVPNRRSVGNESGSGIGLTIARQLAKQHGGSLEAASPGPERGATFTLRLPLTS